MLTNQQFDRTQRLALSLAGIELFDRHRELLGRRSRRLGLRDGGGLDSLLGDAEAGQAAATAKLVGLLTTKVTGFFRHPWHFDLAAEQALWAAHRRGRARLWSAAAATGEEPYSLAMALVEVFGRDDPPADVLATDIDTGALALAARGEYAEPALRAVAPHRRERFFTPSGREGHSLVAASVRRLVDFRPLNLAGAAWGVEGDFDVIFCRNVLMYLEAGCRQRALERVAARLVPGGMLILDPTEHPGPAGHWFSAGADGVYVRRAARHHPAGSGVLPRRTF
jgi:chemotaxis protein methyltransferase CheR